MKHPMTPRGYASLRKELLRLKAMRKELAEAIEIARGHGDLSENGDYDAAKERSGMTEAKIRDLEARLSAAHVVDPQSISLDKVVFGAEVVIQDVESGEERVYTIVGAHESDIERGHLSFESPIGRALIGKEVGDTAQVKTPGQSKEYEIVEVRRADPLFSEGLGQGEAETLE